MFAALFVLVIAAGALAAGVGYVRKARRMRSFRTTRARISGREIIALPSFGSRAEGRFGKGGHHSPKFTYVYEVDGNSYTGDKLGYATRGVKQRIAEEQAAAMPDEVDVHYDPAEPQDAYLELNTPTLGWWLIAGGTLGALVALIALLG